MLFVVPVLNVLFFLLLSVLPGREPQIPARAGRDWLDRWLPHSVWGSAALGVVLTGLAGIGAVALAVKVFRGYGIAVFVMVPFCVGLVAVLLYGYRRRPDWGRCAVVASAAVTLLGLGLIAFMMEGLVCLLMAAPLAYPLAILGGTLGYWIQRAGEPRVRTPPVIQTFALAVPLLAAGSSFTRGASTSDDGV